MVAPVLNVVGAGKLGTVLARLLADRGLASPGSLYSRTLARAQEAAGFVGAGAASDSLDKLVDGELWLLSVPDDAIGAVATELTATRPDWRGTTVFHCSGIQDATILAPLAAAGAETASLHPAHSFARPQASLEGFAGTCCVLEGSAGAQAQLRTLFSALGAEVITIPSGAKPLYHAATAMASNHLVALMDASLAMLRGAGLAEATARRVIAPLATNTLKNIFTAGTGEALTGPIARGDSGTVEKHLAALAANCPDLLPTYVALAQGTLAIATRATTTAGQRDIARLLAAVAR